MAEEKYNGEVTVHCACTLEEERIKYGHWRNPCMVCPNGEKLFWTPISSHKESDGEWWHTPYFGAPPLNKVNIIDYNQIIDKNFMIPKKCILWTKEKLTSDDLSENNFEFIKSLPGISNVSEKIKKCKECGQLYLFEYNDFFANPYSDDLPIYMTYVPVSEEEIVEHLKVEKSLGSIQRHTPKLLHNIKTEGEEIKWIGKLV